MLLILLFLLAGQWLVPGGPVAAAAPAPAPPVTAGEQLVFPHFAPPAQMDLCGQAVPLQEPEVRENLDREFTVVVWSRAQTTMWVKRANRYFPDIEKKLRERRLPLDLKYVVLVESDLRTNAKSPAGAAGPWQFIAPTAQRFQLQADKNIDERLEIGVATDAALKYLETLHRLFQDWPLALAAYNAGEGRVQKAIATQGVSNFYHLSLPDETERYIYRVLAAKIVLEDPGRYGYDLPAEQLYPPLAYDEVRLVTAQEVPVRQIADASGTYYKTIKDLNPWIKGASLGPGSYRLKVPKGAGSRFEQVFRTGP